MHPERTIITISPDNLVNLHGAGRVRTAILHAHYSGEALEELLPSQILVLVDGKAREVTVRWAESTAITHDDFYDKIYGLYDVVTNEELYTIAVRIDARA